MSHLPHPGVPSPEGHRAPDEPPRQGREGARQETYHRGITNLDEYTGVLPCTF